MSTDRVINQPIENETYVSQPITAFMESVRRIYRTNLWRMIAMVLGFIVVGFGLIMGFAGVSFLSFVTGDNSTASDVVAPTISVALFLVGIVFVFGIFVVNVAVDYMYVQAQNMQKTPILAALRRGLQRLFTYIVANILAGLMIIAGFILLIVPGIYIALRLAYMNAIIANEDIGAIDAIKRSFKLTSGHLWDIIGAGSAAVVIVSLATAAATLTAAAATGLPDVATIIIVLIVYVALGLLNVLASAPLYFRYHQSALAHAGALTKQSTDPLNYLLVLAAIAAFALLAATGETPSSSPSLFDENFDTDTSIYNEA